tara:strand:- start:279 stop:530 length:252 start_codon:yes stop_codon:yes gene_type:complete
MENDLLNTLGVDVKSLKEKKIHTRQDCMEILGVSHSTLKRYEEKELLKSSKFRRKKYYTTESIMDCLSKHFNISKGNEWDLFW